MNDETTVEVIYEPIYVEIHPERRGFDWTALTGALVGTVVGICLMLALLWKTGWPLLW